MLRRKFRLLFVCAMLEWGVLVGAPMRPEEIEELMHQINQPKVAHVLPGQSDQGDEPPTHE